MRLFKNLAIFLLCLLLLAVGAIWYLTETFDSERVKAELVQAVAERHDRALRIDGPLTLSFWPRLALDAAQVSVSARGAPEHLAAYMARVRVHVGLLPLLSRQVDVQEMRFEGLKIHLTRDVLKTLESLDGLRDATSIKDRKVAFNVRRVTVTGGALEVVDPINGVTLQLSDVTAFLGPVGKGVRGGLGVEGDARAVGALPATGRFRMTAGFDINGDGVVSLNIAGVDFSGEALGYQQAGLGLSLGGVTADAQGRWQGRDVVLRMTGKGRSGTSEIAADVAEWQWQDGLHLALATASFKRDGERGGALAGRVSNLRTGGEGWTADSLSLEGNLRRDGRSHGVSVQAVPAWRSESAELMLNGLDAQVGWPRADAAPARKLQITGQLAWQPLAGVLASELAFSDGTHRLAGAVSVRPERTPALQFDLHTPLLSLAAYRAELRALWFAPTLPPFAGRLRADRLDADGWRFESLVLPLASDGSDLRLGPFDGAVFNGRVSGQLARDAAGAGTLSVKATGVAIEQWPMAAEATPMLGGGLDADVRLDFDARAADPVATARGPMRFQLNGGAWRGTALIDALRAQDSVLAAALPGDAVADNLPIRAASAEVQVAAGVAQVETLSIRGAWLQLSGQGQIGLGDGALDLSLKAALAEAPKGMSRKLYRKLKTQSQPLSLGGSVAAPVWRTEAASAAR
ncbi:AsmA family protein [Denitromonas halophila]|uniref:AsmA family protein n=1 Tax=Denitromonas halophila TaxID=1629404 RepID=A0A557QY48_9RHOO|nr:AsmA family protein [Denitromonas halophila]TVO57842.1 AsmA family protein [Denitromonas halophila]